jgi:hypothetical protein
LEGRRAEIEDAVLARMTAIADPGEASDPTYAERLRAAVSAALDYGLETIERGGGGEPPIPVELLAQARIAARNRVGLDTVLRRYIAGYSLLGYFMIEEAGREDLMRAGELQRLLGSQAALFDRLLAEVGEEHTRESEARRLPSARREAERIERLLAGETIDSTEIAYEFAGWHLGIVASCVEMEAAIRELAAGVDCRLLMLRREEGTIWAWLGARRMIDSGELLTASGGCSSYFSGAISIGEPGTGLAGWRLTHRQAVAALSVAQRSSAPVVRYGEVALLASVLRDELLSASLRQLYLAPLEREQDGGETLRQTLRAYFGTGHNVSAAAARLGVRRHTVAKRIRTIEERIGRLIADCAPELELALRLHGVDQPNLVAEA